MAGIYIYQQIVKTMAEWAADSTIYPAHVWLFEKLDNGMFNMAISDGANTYNDLPKVMTEVGVAVKTSTETEYVLTITTALGSFDTPNLKGPQGDQGIQGIQGEKGEKGDKGDQGEKGEQGIQGDQGIQGEKGEKGDKGDQGEKGEQGIQGDQGIQGEKGEKGDKGDTGTVGIMLDAKPTEDTLTYIVGDVTYNFELGMSAIYPDAGSDDGYGISFFKGTISEGKAVWERGGQTYEHPKLTAHEKGLYKISVTEEGHVDSAEPVVKEDITALGIPAQDTVYIHLSYNARSSGLYKITVDSTGHVSAATAVTKADITGLDIPARDTTYSAGTGISISGTTIDHASSITAGTSGPTSDTSGTSTLLIPYVTYNATGHITGIGNRTHTINDATESVSGLMPSTDKEKVNRVESYTTATTVASLNVNYKTIYVRLSANASISANATGTSYNGRTITAYVYTSEARTITIPTSGDYVSMCGSSYTTKAGGWVEFSLVCVAGKWHIAKLEQE